LLSLSSAGFTTPPIKSPGKTVAQKVARLKEQGITPELHVVLVGEDKASHSYVNNKAKAALRVGMNFMLHELPETTTEQEMLKTLQTLQENPRLSGLIIQIPLPEHQSAGIARRSFLGSHPERNGGDQAPLRTCGSE
jgi:5,10-methylene-tetrahydrofolate dehydrogenase/methenyl tetrahydrofolate cyclohydrolase